MQIEEKVMTQWGCNFCGDIQGGKRPSKAPALEFLIGPHDEKGHLLICDRCVAICHQKIAQLKVHPVSMNTASARVLSRRYRPLVFRSNARFGGKTTRAWSPQMPNTRPSGRWCSPRAMIDASFADSAQSTPKCIIAMTIIRIIETKIWQLPIHSATGHSTSARLAASGTAY